MTLGLYAFLWVTILVTLPLTLPAALLSDLISPRKFARTRVVAFFVLYLSCEVVGVLAAWLLWLAFTFVPGVSRDSYLAWNFALQRRWARALGRGAFFVFGIRTEVEGDEDLGKRPMILLVRHASVADTILSALLVADTHGVRLRYVLKRELLWDPCLDIVGQRLPNCFVARDGERSDLEISRLGELAEGLSAGEGVLIYPEGTRFSPAKRRRIIDRLEQRGEAEAAGRAAALTHVLPPRLGGTLQLMKRAPEADVVVCAHRGFEATASFWELWKGGLIDARLAVKYSTFPAASLPADDEGRVEWLWKRWKGVDDFVASGDHG